MANDGRNSNHGLTPIEFIRMLLVISLSQFMLINDDEHSAGDWLEMMLMT